MKVLDKGSLRLLDSMGSDTTPVEAARVSYGESNYGDDRDKRLLRYLLTHGHTSPFEMVELMWEVKAPIFVARQWMRYRTANVNEFSMRYAEPDVISETDEIEFYVPDTFRKQSGTNKQASDGKIIGQEVAKKEYMTTHNLAIRTYRDLIRKGVAREQARAVLPVSVYTKFIWKNDLHNTLHFVEQRIHPDAQDEIRQYALAMRDILREEYPLIMEIWEDLHA